VGETISDRGVALAQVSFLPSWVSRTRIQRYCIQVFSGAYTLIYIFLPQTIASYPMPANRFSLARTELLFWRKHSVHWHLLHDLSVQEGHGHSLNVSQTQKHSAESSRHAQAHPYSRSLHRVPYHPCADYPHRSLPISHLSTAPPIRTMLRSAVAAARTRSGYGGDTEEAAPSSWSDMSCTCAYVPSIGVCTLPQHACIRFRHAPTTTLAACPATPPPPPRRSFRASRVYPGHGCVAA
jgi:hypothetical protein